jgi:hypothetical protein
MQGMPSEGILQCISCMAERGQSAELINWLHIRGVLIA